MKRMCFTVFYLTCSVLGWGVMNGTTACNNPWMTSGYLSGAVAALGPIGLVAASASAVDDESMYGRGFHFRMRLLTYEQRWQAFHREYPSLSRYYFDHGHEPKGGCKCDSK